MRIVSVTDEEGNFLAENVSCEEAEPTRQDPPFPPQAVDDAMQDVITALGARIKEDMHSLTEEELDERWWQFEWNDELSPEWNVYLFHKALSLYGRAARRWEEHHHGCSCVVERVRHQYLMPKIRDFLARIP